MKTRLLISGLLILFVMILIPAMAQEDDCVEMDIEIESTKNLDWKICYLEKYASLLIKTSSEEPTDNKIILQKDTFWNYGADCSPTRFFTLINGEENFSKEEYFGDYRILSISLEDGENEIEIIRSEIPGLGANEYCLTEFAESISDSESLNKKWGKLYLEYQLLKESFSNYPNNMTTIERMFEIDVETMRIATILSEREFTIDVPGMSIRNVTFDDPVEPDCGPNTFLNEMGVCQIIDGGCEPDINGNTTWCGPQYDYWKILFSSPIAMLVVFGTPSLITGIVIGFIIWRKRK